MLPRCSGVSGFLAPIPTQQVRPDRGASRVTDRVQQAPKQTAKEPGTRTPQRLRTCREPPGVHLQHPPSHRTPELDSQGATPG